MPPDRTDSLVSDTNEDLDPVTQFENYWREHLSNYVRENPPTWSTNTKVFSFLTLLNAYVPDSYLLEDECQHILGPPDPIDGGPPFEERMEPFTCFINTSDPLHVRIVSREIANKAVELLADAGFTRSNMAKDLMVSLCGDPQPQHHIVQFVKDLLIKREMQEGHKERFSKLISDVLEHEKHYNAVSVLKTASNKFTQNPNFPQTISRVYISRCQSFSFRGRRDPSTRRIQDLRYREEVPRYYEPAETWAREAICRAPQNSYMADTLGQIYKTRLMKCSWREAPEMANQAFRAFKDVEDKAEREEGPQMEDPEGIVSISDSFNNRGLFGFIQVAKIVFEKRIFLDLTTEVETKFNFFEWYLTYSRPTMTTLEPHYFWRDVALCYTHYTRKVATASTSFPALLDLLNRGLFTSRGRRAFSQEVPITLTELERIRNLLKISHEEYPDDVDMAERYILSNLILSNRMPNAPQVDLVTDVQIILDRFLQTNVGFMSPEFYLLVLLLFWPQDHSQGNQEDNDEECKTPEDEESNSRTWEDLDGEEPEQPRPPGLMFDLDMQRYATYMETAFERVRYAKYLRGRYLLPLFFLGKGSGLTRWIHKSRLDAIVEDHVDTELTHIPTTKSPDREKIMRINKMWINGSVWHLQQIREILLPVRVEPLQEGQGQEVFVHAGEIRVKARTEAVPGNPAQATMIFYLGFTIQGPVVFKVGVPQNAEM